MTKKNMQKSTSLTITEMQITSTMRQHFTLSRMAITKKIKNENNMSWQDVEKLELSYMLGGM